MAIRWYTTMPTLPGAPGHWPSNTWERKNVVDYPEPWKASESFSEYVQHGIPGLFYRLGTRVAGTPATPLHTDTLLVDEQCLELGYGFMAYLAWSELGRQEF